jgi:hypothetical protein
VCEQNVLIRVQEEHLRYQRLCDQLDESNVFFDNLQDELDELRDQLAILTYNPGSTVERCFTLCYLLWVSVCVRAYKDTRK